MAAFLDWYRARVTVPVQVTADWWLHALWTLTVGELRAGMRRYDKEHRERGYLGPVRFWYLCRKGYVPELSWKRHVARRGEDLKEE